MKNIIFVTVNKEKIAIAKNAFLGSDYGIVAKQVECEEIQADDTSEIAKHSAKFVSEKLRTDVIKMDKGLFVKVLGGFPGPYSAFVEKRLDCSDILKMLNDQKERGAFYKESIAFCEFGKEPIVFESYTNGRIAIEAKGEHGWNFDRFFICDGDEETMACFDDEERIKKYNNANWKKLIEHLNTIYSSK